jgi:hypothetical protein
MQRTRQGGIVGKRMAASSGRGRSIPWLEVECPATRRTADEYLLDEKRRSAALTFASSQLALRGYEGDILVRNVQV